ncbi:FGGY-family carbohydrate kinase [Anaerolentibacter hominis]|uniref:xylulokinase n=1 Tax=Anaerolentibacter hominis TaxID=3079009 RepID=UPI0031B7F9D9
MKQYYLIAHDLGTTGDKATLFRLEGEEKSGRFITGEGVLVRSVIRPYETQYFNGNWAEQKPEDWWRAFCTANRELLEGIDPDLVAGLAFSGQMMGCVLVDRQGMPLRDAIIWADQRAVKQEQQLRDKIPEEEFYHITGHRISASYSLEKLMWVRENEPETFAGTYKMLLPKDFMIHRLTGQFVTDYSDASGTNAFDLNRLVWSERILKAAEIPAGVLPEVKPSAFAAGKLNAGMAKECSLPEGLTIILGGGDGVCASVGAGSVRENVAYNYLGSSSWISYTSRKPVYDPELRTFNWAHMIPGYYAPCGTMQAAGNSYSFMKKVLGDGLDVPPGMSVYDKMNELAECSLPGAGGLIFLPYLLGERSPRWNPDARGAFIGLKMEHTKGDMLRAALEGIIMNLDIILKIFKDHADIPAIHIIGGLAKGEAVRRILADIYGMPVVRLHYLEEATSMGAAAAAGVGSGLFAGYEEIEKLICREETILPNPERSLAYEPVKKVFDHSYQALMDIYRELAQI